MPNISIKNENVYKCDTCHRNIRVPANPQGIEVVQRCIITAKCLGKMQRVANQDEINNTPTIPLEVTGLKDWSTRSVLFDYTQTVKMAAWKVAHNLENNPTVYVYVNRNGTTGTMLVEVDPKSIEIIDLNNILITFDQPESGQVQCVALSSQNTAVYHTLAINNASTSDMQITNRGELTFATLDPSPTTSVKVMFNSPSSPQPVVVEYLNIATVSILSPWDGASYVTINSKKYYIKSVNLLTWSPAPLVFQSGLVSSGATVYFPNSTVAGQLLLLLANNPQSIADRIYDRYVDTASANVSTPQLYYNTGNVYVAQSMVKNTYPPIFTG